MKFDKESATAENTGGGSKVLDTGVYDITINTASQSIASTGTEGIDWNFTVEGSQYSNVIYGMWILKANGDKIFNYDIVQSLMGIANIKEMTLVDKTIEVKDGKKTVKAYKELNGVKCKVAVQKVLDVYNNEVREKNEIKAFFGSDGKTYAEFVKRSEAKQITYYSEKLEDKETSEYKKFMMEADTTEEDNSKSLL